MVSFACSAHPLKPFDGRAVQSYTPLSLHIRLQLGLDNLTPLYILHDVSYILHPFKSLHIRLHLGLELTGMQYYTYIVHAIFLPLSLMLLYILHIPINLGFDLTQNQFWDKRCKLPWGQDVCAVRTNRLTESEFDRTFG